MRDMPLVSSVRASWRGARLLAVPCSSKILHRVRGAGAATAAPATWCSSTRALLMRLLKTCPWCLLMSNSARWSSDEASALVV
jgi:hypothetical protein